MSLRYIQRKLRAGFEPPQGKGTFKRLLLRRCQPPRWACPDLWSVPAALPAPTSPWASMPTGLPPAPKRHPFLFLPSNARVPNSAGTEHCTASFSQDCWTDTVASIDPAAAALTQECWWVLLLQHCCYWADTSS